MELQEKENRLEALRKIIKNNSYIKQDYWANQLWIWSNHFSNFVNWKAGLRPVNIEKLEKLIKDNIK